MTMQELDLDTSDFAALGEHFIAEGFVKSARVRNAGAHLMKVRQLVDFGASWLSDIRGKRHERRA
jgi:aminoglycoside N3'-acetyltransferase